MSTSTPQEPIVVSVDTTQRRLYKFVLNLPTDAVKTAKHTLFINNVSVQEFFAQVLVMVAKKPEVFVDVFNAARTSPFSAKKKIVSVSIKNVYDILDNLNPLKTELGETVEHKDNEDVNNYCPPDPNDW